MQRERYAKASETLLVYVRVRRVITKEEFSMEVVEARKMIAEC
jgi:hypothetical protein